MDSHGRFRKSCDDALTRDIFKDVLMDSVFL